MLHSRSIVGALSGAVPVQRARPLFIFEIALAPRLGKLQYDEVYAAIAAAIAGAVSSWPEAKDLLPGKIFVRYLH